MPNTAEVHLKERVIQRVSHISIELLSSVCYRKIQTSGKHVKRQKQSTDKGPCAQLTTPRASREPAWLVPPAEDSGRGPAPPPTPTGPPGEGQACCRSSPAGPSRSRWEQTSRQQKGLSPLTPSPARPLWASLSLPAHKPHSLLAWVEAAPPCCLALG